MKNKIIIRTQGASPCLKLLDYLPNFKRHFPGLDFEVTEAVRDSESKIIGNKSKTGAYPCLEFWDLNVDREHCPNGQLRTLIATSDYEDAVSFLLLCSALKEGGSCARQAA